MTVIRAVDVYGYELSYVHGSYTMSSGRRIDTLPSTVVRITTTSGVEGFGEVCPLGETYLPAFGEGARAALRQIAPALIGVDAGNLAVVSAAMDDALMGHAYAKSAVDIACWDVLGRALGAPVSQLLGGVLAERFPLYVAVPMRGAEEMAAFVRERRAEGVRHLQLKLGGNPHDDAARTAGVVAAAGDDAVVIADANCGWRLQDAIVAARLMDGLDRVFLEQPCQTLEQCLAVRERSTLPMVLDEIILDVPSLLRAYAANGLEAFNLKLSRVGGLSRAKLLRDLAVELGLRVTIEDSWGGDLTTAAVSHLAASTQPGALFTVSFMNDWTNEHIAGYRPRSQGGWGAAPDGPGLGVDVDLAALGEPLFTAR